MSKHELGAANREGFTLVEVVMAIVLLAAVLVCLGGLTYQAARQAINVGNGAGRQAIALELVNRLTAMPYDSLPKNTTSCDTVQTTAGTRYRRCYLVGAPANRRISIEVTVTPLRAGSYEQSFHFDRAAGPAPNPLNVQ